MESCRKNRERLKTGYYSYKKDLNQLLLLIKDQEIERKQDIIKEIEGCVSSVSAALLRSLLAVALEVEVTDLVQQTLRGTLSIDLIVIRVRTWLEQFILQLRRSYNDVFGDDIKKLSHFINQCMKDSFGSDEVLDAASYKQRRLFLKRRLSFYSQYQLRLENLETLLLEQ